MYLIDDKILPPPLRALLKISPLIPGAPNKVVPGMLPCAWEMFAKNVR